MTEEEDPVQLSVSDDDVRLFDGCFPQDGDKEDTLVISDEEHHEVASKMKKRIRPALKKLMAPDYSQ